jgi:hypothetical protein
MIERLESIQCVNEDQLSPLVPNDHTHLSSIEISLPDHELLLTDLFV